MGGLLFGGNFKNWNTRTMAILRVHNLEHYATQGTIHQLSGDQEEERSRTAGLIALLVQPDIIDRVPQSERSNPKLLMSRLEVICTHFRFLDLPPEVRNRIYSFLLPNGGRCKLGAAQTDREKASGYPPITKVSRQIRQEALPIFYHATTFVFCSDKLGTQLAKSARIWMAQVVQDNMKHIRIVTVRLNIKTARHSKMGEIKFTYDLKHGLSVQYPQNLSDSSKQRIDELVRSAKDTAEFLQMPNGSQTIWLALSMDVEVWKYGTLILV